MLSGEFHQLSVVYVSGDDTPVFVLVEQVGHAVQNRRGGEGPGGAIPAAGVSALVTGVVGAVLLRGAKTVTAIEAAGSQSIPMLGAVRQGISTDS